MTRSAGPSRSGDEWQPATSRPGEIFTPEGQIRSVGVFARNLTRRDPRGKRYRRSMQRTALLFLAAGAALCVIVLAAAALF